MNDLDTTVWQSKQYKIMAAQAANLARIEPGVELGTSGPAGETNVFVGPKPDLVRFEATPLRLQADSVIRLISEEGRYNLTVAPVLDSGKVRAAGKDGRQFTYGIFGIVQLTSSEQREEEESQGVANLLAHRMDEVLHDLELAFFERLLLPVGECIEGLVDDSEYAVRWFEEVQYPRAGFVMTVTCDYYGYHRGG